MDPLVHRIRETYDALPLGERKLAELILEMRGDLAAYSATELAARSGVSKATAARLVRRLGYADFHEMRQQARNHYHNGSPLAELSNTRDLDGTLAEHLGHDIAYLRRTIETIPADHVQAAVKILAGAQRVTVVGFRNSYPLAFYARELLVQVRPQVNLLPVPGQTVAEEFSDLGRGDAVLAFGFRRRPPVLGRILRAAAAAKARTVLLGDSSLGKVGKSAHIVFRCYSRGARLFDSYVAAMSLVNYLGSGVALALGASAQERLRRIESLHEEFSDLER
ncbi:MAG: MurR/RpiR family transcriptional regulator [Rhizobiales bacterium]|nr:MurR/RpiR family transcriptional regulator [Hyphomicrobiales bacterium]